MAQCFYVAGDAAGDSATVRAVRLSDRGTEWSLETPTPARCVAVGADGYVYVCGGMTLTGHVSKYTRAGALVWSVAWPNIPRAVAADAAGHVLVGGNPTDDATTWLLDADGEELWNANHGLAVNAVAFDADGNAYTAGGTSGDRIATRCYTPAGALVWSAEDHNIMTGLAVDATHAYTTGSANFVGSAWVCTHAHALGDGAIPWRTRPVHTGRCACVDAVALYVVGTESTVHGQVARVSKADGVATWLRGDLGTDLQGVTLDHTGAVLYVAGKRVGDTTVWGLDTEDGETLWTWDHGADLYAIAVGPAEAPGHWKVYSCRFEEVAI